MYKNNKPYNITNKLKTRREICDGIEPKFWLFIDGSEYLYKYNPDFEDATFGEVFVSALCKRLGVKCVDAKFAYGTVHGEKTKGCLIKSYIDEDICENISLMRITDKLQEPWDIANNDCTRESTPSNILEDLTNYLKGKNCEIDPSVLQDLKVMALFDYVTAQIDRHEKNIEFLVTKKDGALCISLAPMYDNGRCFGFVTLNVSGAERERVNYVTGGRSVLVMDQDLCKSDGSVCDCSFGIAKELAQNHELLDLFNKMADFDIQNFITSFMNDTNEHITTLRERQVVDTWNHRINKIKRALEQYADPKIRQQIEINIEKNRRAEFIYKNNLYETDFHLNYYFDKSHSCARPLFEYLKQDEEYRSQIEDWENMRTNELKTVEDYPLLKNRCDLQYKKKYLQKINQDQFERKIEAREYKNQEPDYFELEKLQRLKNICLGKSNEKPEVVFDEISKKKVSFHKLLRDWVTYGDELLQKPKHEDVGIDTAKQYDDAVVEKYIMNHEMQGRIVRESYQTWLQKVGKADFAQKIRQYYEKNF